MKELVTIHGTFAGDENETGTKWWQQGSPFLTKLQTFVVEPFEVRPFRWSGKNSEISRRNASKVLSKEIQKSSEPPILLGHSHGGSVAMLATANRGKKWLRRDNLAGLVTVGMPFLRFRRHRNPFSRFNELGRLLLLIACLFMIQAFATTDWNGTIFDPTVRSGRADTGKLFHAFASSIGNPAFIFSLVAFFLLFVAQRQPGLRARFLASGEIEKSLKSRFCSLHHPLDEAVQALRRTLGLRPKVVRIRIIFIGVTSFIAFTIVAFEVATFAARVAITDRSFYDEANNPRIYGYPSSSIDLPAIQFDGTNTNQDLYWRLVAPRYVITGTLQRVQAEELLSHRSVENALLFLERHERPALLARALRNVKGQFLLHYTIDEEAFALAFAHALYAFPSWIQKVEATTPAENAFYLSTLANPNFHKDLFSTVLSSNSTPDAELALYRFLVYTLTFRQRTWSGDTNTFESQVLPPFFYIRPGQEHLVPEDLVGWTGVRSSVLFEYSKGRSSTFGTANRVIGEPIQTQSDNTNPKTLPDILREYKAYIGIQAPGFRLLYHWNLSGRMLLGWVGGDTYFNLAKNFPMIRMLVDVFVVSVMGGIGVGLLSFFFLQSFTGSLLKKIAFGNDVFGETVTGVMTGPSKNERVGNLPETVCKQMLENSHSDAARTAEKLRHMLIAAQESLVEREAPLAGVEFDGSELMHNAYFHSEEFIKFLAVLFVERYGFTPSDALRNDANFADYKKLLTEI